jgi:ubiquinone biosynthesis protein Coq4
MLVWVTILSIFSSWDNLKTMGFKYIDELAKKKNIDKFLEFIDLAAGSGKDTNNVFDMSEKFNSTVPMQRCIKAIEKDPKSAAFVKERYVGSLYDLKAMLEMPKYSLGWTYAKILSTLDYDPQFYRRPESFASDAEYITFRVYKTHDLHHILTGFSLDGLGELGVISVSAAQFSYPAFIFLDLTSLLASFAGNDELYNEDSEPAEVAKTLGYKFKVISLGLEMGQAAKPLFPIKWEDQFERPIDEVREELNIKPVKDGIFSWYTRPQLAAAVA